MEYGEQLFLSEKGQCELERKGEYDRCKSKRREPALTTSPAEENGSHVKLPEGTYEKDGQSQRLMPNESLRVLQLRKLNRVQKAAARWP